MCGRFALNEKTNALITQFTPAVARFAGDGWGELHDRMPVFLEPDVFDRWLDTEKLADDGQKSEMLAMLDYVSGEVASTITTYEVDRKVNNSRTVDPADASLMAAIG